MENTDELATLRAVLKVLKSDHDALRAENAWLREALEAVIAAPVTIAVPIDEKHKWRHKIIAAEALARTGAKNG